MNIFEKYYILGELKLMNLQGFQLPRSLQSVAQTQAIADIQGLSTELKQLLDTLPGMHLPNWEFYFQTLEVYALLQTFLYEVDSFAQVHQQLQELNSRSYLDIPEYAAAHNRWMPLLQFITQGFHRVIRKVSLESFEEQIDNLEWSEIPSELVYKFAAVIAYVYRSEGFLDTRKKGKFWLEKAYTQAPSSLKFVLQTSVLGYQIEIANAESLGNLDARMNQLQQAQVDSVYNNARLELLVALKARLLMAHARFTELPSEKEVQLHTLRRVLSMHLSKISEQEYFSLYYFTKLYVTNFLLLESLYQGGSFISDEVLKQERNGLLDGAIGHIDYLVNQMVLPRNLQVELLILKSRILITQNNQKEAARILKECAFHYRKMQLLPLYAEAHFLYAGMYLQINKAHKAYEAGLEVFRYGVKRIDHGGFYICIKAFRFINQIFTRECDRPGITWMIKEIRGFFIVLQQLHDLLPTVVDKIGSRLFEEYKREYLRLQRPSHFNIKTYFLYQLHQIKVLELCALFNDDTLGAQIAANLLENLHKKDNPLSFIYADWPDFKDVPHDVRNKVINRCISITKGDLPLAAEHLDFSYRNLRSYITYNEVNRLGFFLEERDTSAKKLELGVRYLLYDLYLKGKIFDVVFDMPRFLVNHATNGFSATTMERELNIKYNTAKKYLKIMLEIGLIETDTTRKRKNYYSLNKEHILLRYHQHISANQTTESIKEKESANTASPTVPANSF